MRAVIRKVTPGRRRNALVDPQRQLPLFPRAASVMDIYRELLMPDIVRMSNETSPLTSLVGRRVTVPRRVDFQGGGRRGGRLTAQRLRQAAERLRARDAEPRFIRTDLGDVERRIIEANYYMTPPATIAPPADSRLETPRSARESFEAWYVARRGMIEGRLRPSQADAIWTLPVGMGCNCDSCRREREREERERQAAANAAPPEYSTRPEDDPSPAVNPDDWWWDV